MSCYCVQVLEEEKLEAEEGASCTRRVVYEKKKKKKTAKVQKIAREGADCCIRIEMHGSVNEFRTSDDIDVCQIR